jgi:hypothetical protein
MPLVLTVEILRAAYDLLAGTPPFSNWNLPDGEDVTFRVLRRNDRYGQYQLRYGRHHIAVSRSCIGTLNYLLVTLAHEMTHMHEERVGVGRGDVAHGREFRKWALQICRVHGFDSKAFF